MKLIFFIIYPLFKVTFLNHRRIILYVCCILQGRLPIKTHAYTPQTRTNQQQPRPNSNHHSRNNNLLSLNNKPHNWQIIGNAGVCQGNTFATISTRRSASASAKRLTRERVVLIRATSPSTMSAALKYLLIHTAESNIMCQNTQLKMSM